MKHPLIGCGSDNFPALDDAHDHHHQRKNEQDMDEAPKRVTADQAERPQENQDYRDSFQHVRASLSDPTAIPENTKGAPDRSC
jgi:hypothetical protein